ncbi:MAG: hypothetical protein GWM87_01825, partial [Xanthomonadales bacterium]|nr:hypothetical protein [Xanthomonadales bacterium]NIX11821.1 hypothetical protein [Xanthomonadales bacterium]
MGTTAAQVPRWKTPGGLFLLVLAGTMLAYLPTLGSGFFSDDILYIVGNQTLQQWPLTQIFGLFTERTNPYEYLPLRDLSYRLDMALFGVSAWGFHLHNLLLYGLSCAAAWLAARSVINLLARGAGATPSPWDEVRQRRGAAAAAMLFAVHPAHVESVAWVAGRKDLLSGLLALLALHLYVQGLASGRVLWFRVSAAWVLFALALASKATVLPLALAAVLLAALAGRSATSRRWIG